MASLGWTLVRTDGVTGTMSADYALRWIDKLQLMADDWPGWRSERERIHVFTQFEEAREIYRRRRAEAGGGDR